MMNAAGMAIELYLKCLAAEVIHIPEQKTDTPRSMSRNHTAYTL